jgi:hypothetical protein
MDDDAGVPLSHYRVHGADVLLICLDCQRQWTVPLEEVIERLESRGLDGSNVGIRELRRYLTAPCSRCGSGRIETRPAFPPGKPKL